MLDFEKPKTSVDRVFLFADHSDPELAEIYVDVKTLNAYEVSRIQDSVGYNPAHPKKISNAKQAKVREQIIIEAVQKIHGLSVEGRALDADRREDCLLLDELEITVDGERMTIWNRVNQVLGEMRDARAGNLLPSPATGGEPEPSAAAATE